MVTTGQAVRSSGSAGAGVARRAGSTTGGFAPTHGRTSFHSCPRRGFADCASIVQRRLRRAFPLLAAPGPTFRSTTSSRSSSSLAQRRFGEGRRKSNATSSASACWVCPKSLGLNDAARYEQASDDASAATHVRARCEAVLHVTRSGGIKSWVRIPRCRATSSRPCSGRRRAPLRLR
jgi:hypothetical protein